MEKYVIKGGKRLQGEVTISAAKNSAVAILPAALLSDEPCLIDNVPDISDIDCAVKILRRLGADVKRTGKNKLLIDPRHIHSDTVEYELGKNMRASYYFMGALLGKVGHANVSMPGGCDLGARPIDQHLKGFQALGADNTVDYGMVRLTAPELRGSHIYFDVVTVGGTINVMLAACKAKGLTIIENAAKEPHIVDVANFLNSMGADIMGAGTDVIKIRGVETLHGGTYSVIPDQIEAGTYMAAVMATGGSVLVRNVIPKHLECITAKLEEMGAQVEELDDAVRVTRLEPLNKINLKTLPYPGFPTDMQPQLVAALCLAQGTSVITEGVWDNRYRYVEELRRRGARIQVDGKVAIVEGVPELTGAKVQACDLRAGAAMVIAGLAAHGTTEVDGIAYIERGYENIVEKLQGLGADITRVTVPEEDRMPMAR